MTINYNKVKTEGLEEFEEKWLSYDDNNGFVSRKMAEGGQLNYRDGVLVRRFLSTYAEKVHKATLEDVLEFLGEDIPRSENWVAHSDEAYEEAFVNKERQRIRDYIKTLTK